jgi:hypothetical protein
MHALSTCVLPAERALSIRPSAWAPIARSSSSATSASVLASALCANWTRCSTGVTTWRRSERLSVSGQPSSDSPEGEGEGEGGGEGEGEGEGEDEGEGEGEGERPAQQRLAVDLEDVEDEASWKGHGRCMEGTWKVHGR